MKYAASVVLYNPSTEELNNTLFFANNFDVFLIFDNSTKPYNIADFLEKLTCKYIYFCNHGNYGLFVPLKEALEYCSEHGYDFLMVANQDSVFKDVDFFTVFKDIASLDNIDSVAQIGLRFEKEKGNSIKYRMVNIVSGNFINIGVYKKIAPINDDLFMDCVDIDYSLTCLKHGFFNIELPYAFYHPLGYGTKTIHFFGKNITFEKYSYFRYYYIVRGHIFLQKKYGNEFGNQKNNWKQLFGAVLGLKPHLKYLKAIVCGFCDGKKGILGKYKAQERFDRRMMKKNEKVV